MNKKLLKFCTLILLFIALGIGIFFALRLKTHHLPLPKTLTHIKIQPQNLTFQKSGQTWQNNGKESPRFAQWLKNLETACPIHYPKKDITLPENKNPINLTLNHNTTLEFGAHHPYYPMHYLTYEDKIYLCDETLKLQLTLSPDYWTNENAGTP